MAEDFQPQLQDLVGAVQQGDLVFIQACFDGNHFGPNVVDSQGCSILHWAAINNRISIIRYLLETKKANVDIIGGDLEETPLQWAIRYKQYTYLIYYLLVHAKANTQIKNIHGHDALHLACQHGCTNHIYLLMELGEANIDSFDNQGDTPLYWSIQNVGYRVDDVPRILMKYNADVLRLNNDGKDALAIAGSYNGVNLVLAFQIFRSIIRITATRCADKSDLPAAMRGYIDSFVARNETAINSTMKSFLFDAYLYSFYSPHIPTVASAGLVCSIFIVVYFLGIAYGSGIIVLLFLGWKSISQQTIRQKLSRHANGFAWGIIITIISSYYIFLVPIFPNVLGVIFNSLICGSIIYTLAITTGSKPRQLHQMDDGDSKVRLIEKLVATGLVDGPSINPSGRMDPVTSTSSNICLECFLRGDYSCTHLDGEREVKLCSTCLVDKSAATTHCASCDICVVGLDHHCDFVNNCVAKDNRRIFVMFTLSASLGCLIYFFLAVIAEFAYFCPDVVYSNYLIGLIYVQLCMFQINPSLWAVKFLSIFCTAWIGVIGVGQLSMVMTETTTYEILKGQSNGNCNCSWKGLSSLVKFFRTGYFSIVATKQFSKKASPKLRTPNNPTHGHHHFSHLHEASDEYRALYDDNNIQRSGEFLSGVLNKASELFSNNKYEKSDDEEISFKRDSNSSTNQRPSGRNSTASLRNQSSLAHSLKEVRGLDSV